MSTTSHSSVLAWRIPWTEEPGGLQSVRLQRVGHDQVHVHKAEEGLPIGTALQCSFPASLPGTQKSIEWVQHCLSVNADFTIGVPWLSFFSPQLSS